MRIALSSELPGRPGILGAASARFGAEASFASDAAMAAEMSGAARENLSQRAYLRIRSSLIHSELRPGQRLVLRPLAAELQLSPTPVREALLRLLSEQALTLDERGSAIVPVIGQEEFSEIIDIRCDLEGRAAVRAAACATASEIEHVAAIAAAYQDAARRDDRVAMLGCNAELHRRVCRIARAPLILRILEGIWMRIGPVYALTLQEAVPASSEDAVGPHEQLLAALRAHDPEAAREAVIRDVRRSSEWLARCLAEAAAARAV